MARPAAKNSKPARRTPAETPDARARILAAGLEVFSDEGFAGTTTREIATRAGVNLGLIKYYFGSKDALWRAVVDGVFTALATEVGEVEAQGGGEPRAIEKLVRSAVRFIGHNPAFVRLMNDECKRDSARMRWLVDRHGRPLYDRMVAVLRRMKRKGLVPNIPDVHLYYLFIGAAGMLFSQAPECARFTGKDPTTDERMIRVHADAMVKLFLGASRL
jgi:AcrR family transcriptional regulator